MANPIDITVTPQALREMDNLITKIHSARDGYLLLGQSILDASKNTSKINTPSGLTNNKDWNAKINAEIQQQSVTIKGLADQIKLLSLAKIELTKEESKQIDNLKKVNSGIVSNNNVVASNIRLTKLQQSEIDKTNKLRDKEIVLAEKNANAYNKTQAQINKLTAAYNDLAVRKARYNNLSENEEKRLVTLSAVNEKYNGVLKSTDATIGKNQRNVGNYASGYNALGNSINQLSREAPAFANSINTGFMAISNNLPSLFDAIGGIRAQNVALAAEGKPTVSILKQLAGALFSWQTLLSVGVTLLTLYGGKIVEFIAGNKEATDSTKSLAEAQKTALEGSVKELSTLDTLREKVTNVNAPMSERLKIVKELQDEYPSYFGNMTAEQILADKTGDAYAQLAKDILASAKARAIAGEIEKIAIKQLAIETEIALNKSGKYNIKNALNFNLLAQIKDAASGSNTNTMKAIITNQEKELKDLSTAQQKLLDEYVKIDTGKLGDDGKDGKTKTDKSGIKAEEDRLKAIAELRKKELELQLARIDELLNNEELYYTDRLTALDSDFIKRNEIAKIDYDEEYRLSQGNQDKQKTALINFQLEKIKLIESYTKQKNTLEALDLDPVTKLAKSKSETDPFKSLTESGKNAEKSLEQIGKRAEETEKRILKLRAETTNWLNSFSSEFLQNSGMDSLQTFFDGSFDKLLEGAEGKEKFAVYFNAIAESAQQAFNLIASYSQANFDGEKKRIEEQQAIAISYAGGSAVAIAKINEDAEKQKKEIANRENKAKQKQAIFNIAIDTAQAIMATVGKTGFAGLPLALILGALGAAQIAMVATQKIPQYFDGTDNHIGGKMLVNDGKGANYKEKVILPSGQVILPQGRNVLMNAPKGTKVLTHEQQLMEMMQDNGISMSRAINQNNGMTSTQMDVIMGKHFGNMKTVNNYVDQKGFHSYIQNGNSRTIMNQNRVSGSGISV